jgi:WD40 repeat protein/tetratricopeptide (TPR) repeat protein
VAEALAYAHAQGTLHRDVKPSNLLLDTQGTVWVTDFGLAKGQDGGDLTGTGDLVGTLRYMAPERFAGRSDARSDVYALGLTLYELLTLRPAFGEADRSKLIAQVQHAEPPGPRRLDPAVPRDLETVVLKAMSKDPGHRYPSAADLAEDLRRFAEDKPIRARRVGPAERLWRWCRRNPLVASLAAAVAVLLVAVAVVSAVMAFHIGAANTDLAEARDEAKRQAKTARGHADKEKEERRKREKALARLYVSNGAQALDRGDLFGSLPWFVAALKIEKDDPRQAEVHRIRLHTVLQQCPRVQLFFQDAPVKAPEFREDGRSITASDRSADGRRVVKVQNRDRLELLGAGTVGWMADPLGQGALVAAAAASRARIARRHSEARVWDTATGRAVTPPLKYDGAGGLLRAFFSPDGRRVYTAGCRWITAEDRIEIEEQIWDAVTGKPVTPPLKRAGAPAAHVTYDAEFSPNGKCVLSHGYTHTSARPLIPGLWVWEATTGLLIMSSPQPEPGWVRFNPDGRRLLFEDHRGGVVQLWDIAARVPIGGPLGTRAHSYDAWTWGDFSRNGRRVITRSKGEADNQHDLRVWAAHTGKPLSPPIQTEVWPNSYGLLTSLSADGSRILAGRWQPGIQSEVRVLDAATGRPISPRLPFDAQLSKASFSRDGRHVLMASHDGKGRLWDLATVAYSDSFLRLGTPLSRGAFSPDGRRALSASDQGVQLWHTTTGQPAGLLFRLNPDKPNHPAYDSISHVSFSPDGRLILAVGRRAVTAEGASRRWVSEARILDAVTGRPIAPLLQPGGTISQHAFSPDSRRVLLVVENATKPGAEVQVWDVSSGRLARPPRKLGQWAKDTTALFSADLRYLATASRGKASVQVRVWDTTSGEAITPPLTMPGNNPRVAFSPDGRRVAASGVVGNSIAEVRIWDITTGHLLIPIRQEYQRAFTEVAFRHDGVLFATASEDRTARVWNATTGEAVTPPLQHEAPVAHVEFSPDGRRLLTTTQRTVCIWDAETGEPLTPPLRPGSHVSAAAFLPERLLSDPHLPDEYLPLWRPVGSWPGPALFTSDGWHVLIFHDANEVQVWDLSPDRRPLDDLELLVGLLSGRKIDATGASVPFATRQSDWQKLKTAYPKAFTVPEHQVTAWRQAEQREKERAKKAAGEIYANRGQGHVNQVRLPHVNQFRLPEAAAEFARAIELGHDDVWTWTTMALVRLAWKDEAGYRQARADMLKRFGTTRDAGAAGVFAWNYCLAPAARSELEPVLKMLDKVAPADVACRGLLLYRLGRFEEAVNCLNETIARSPNKEGRGADWFFLAMSHHRLGHGEEAERWLAKAVRYTKQVQNARERLELQILQREAEALINGQAEPPRK